jgi:Sec-independent protein translocase protein TatA
MSIGELIVILIIGLLVIKPEDIPGIIRLFGKISGKIHRLKNETLGSINSHSVERVTILSSFEEAQRINFFITKISEMGFDYIGEYDVETLRVKYNDLMRDQAKLNSSVSN